MTRVFVGQRLVNSWRCIRCKSSTASSCPTKYTFPPTGYYFALQSKEVMSIFVAITLTAIVIQGY